MAADTAVFYVERGRNTLWQNPQRGYAEALPRCLVSQTTISTWGSARIETNAGPLSVCCVTVFFMPPATATYGTPPIPYITTPPPYRVVTANKALGFERITFMHMHHCVDENCVGENVSLRTPHYAADLERPSTQSAVTSSLVTALSIE